MTAINTTKYDQFRQGIYAQGLYSRRGITPVVEPTLTGSFSEDQNFGQAREVQFDTPFDDVSKFSPTLYINDVGGGERYSPLLTNVNIREPSQADGVIEPFVIKASIARTSVDHPHEVRTIRGEWGNGNEDHGRRHDHVDPLFDFKAPSVVSPFIDMTTRMGDSDAGAISLPITGSRPDAVVSPFVDDQRPKIRVFDKTATGADMLVALEAMSPGTDNYAQNDQRSARTGFTYQNVTQGIDSIAFGGQRRS